jgi:Cu/Zn superoxide dismutase
MSWGYYSGDVTDYATNPPATTIPPVPNPDLFKDARASAIMIGMDGRSFFRLRVSGIDAVDGKYGVHLHQGTCVAGDSVAAGPHYNVTWDDLEKKIMGDINNKTEVWLDLDVDSDGDARSTATVSFIPGGPRSIVLHALPTAADGTAGARLACMPFKIKASS